MSLPNIGEIERDDCLAIGQTVGEAQSASGLTPSPYFRWKGILDRLLAAILLVPALPIIALLVLLVRLTSPGPGIYRQTRVGKNGREFKLYKIRTMTHRAEEETGPVWARERDPRITLVGRFLRKLHLDEFPQLFNVLKGQMSLVGPRPERPDFVYALTKQVPGYRNRLAVRPGITGLAQLNLRPDTDAESVRRKLVLDLDYIENGGLLLDVRLLLCTFARLFKFKFAVRLFGLKRRVIGCGLSVPGSNGSDGADHSPLSPESIAGQTLSYQTGGDGKTAKDVENLSLRDTQSHQLSESIVNPKPISQKPDAEDSPAAYPQLPAPTVLTPENPPIHQHAPAE